MDYKKIAIRLSRSQQRISYFQKCVSNFNKV